MYYTLFRYTTIFKTNVVHNFIIYLRRGDRYRLHREDTDKKSISTCISIVES